MANLPTSEDAGFGESSLDEIESSTSSFGVFYKKIAFVDKTDMYSNNSTVLIGNAEECIF